MSKFILSAFADEIDPDLKVQMDVLEQHDIRYIEMRGVYGKNLVQYSLEEVKEIKKQLDDRGFKISAIGSPIGKIGILDDFEPHLELFKHTIEIAKILETDYIRMFSFYIPKGDDPAKYRDEVIRRWEEFIKAAEGTGLTLLHENEKGIYGDTAERCLDLLKTLDCDYVKLTFDPANFVQCDVETYPHAFNLLKSYIAYMHIKDALYSNHSVVPSGYGDGKVKEILTELYQMGYEGFLSIEPHLGNFVGFSELEQGIVDPNMPEGGPKQFGIAANALKKILSQIERRE
ncbi:sugar phosphate isomerase/epimerase [Caldicoprobacter algeriensis]|uniref:sugar phosphate isomerase/epimerase family protein n=1 Tax=Caldicoprobacter algeriensis TaxID=699281 RepID=UPI002079D789|nr:sugar phosphate isomerase/epimerase [Caldicoprobacter algeriensis]